MNILRLNFQNSSRPNDSFSASFFHNKSHRKALIQNSKLSLGSFFVSRVHKNSSVKQSSMNIRHHRANIPQRIRGLSFSGVLLCIDVVFDRVIPESGITLINRIDFASLGDLNIGVRKNKLTKRGVERVAVDLLACRENKLGRRPVHAVPSSNHVSSLLQDIV